jgi:predicted RNA-binding protein with PUA-like domain
VSGLAEVSREARPEKDPAWSMVDIRFVKKFPAIVPLETLKRTRGLEKMLVVKRGVRLSVQPVTKSEYEIIAKLGL